LTVALLLQPALTVRTAFESHAACLFGCGNQRGEMTYEGEKISFNLGSYGDYLGTCHKQCKLVEVAEGASNMFKKNSCGRILKGSKKIAKAWTKSKIRGSKLLKLCCITEECENKSCWFPVGHNQMNTTFKSSKEAEADQLSFRFGKGENVDYKLPPGYCVKECFLFMGSDQKEVINRRCAGQRSKTSPRRNHLTIATTQSSSGGTFAKLCCAPMLAPEQVEQTVQEVPVNPELDPKTQEDEPDLEDENKETPSIQTSQLVSGVI